MTVNPTALRTLAILGVLAGNYTVDATPSPEAQAECWDCVSYDGGETSGCYAMGDSAECLPDGPNHCYVRGPCTLITD